MKQLLWEAFESSMIALCAVAAYAAGFWLWRYDTVFDGFIWLLLIGSVSSGLLFALCLRGTVRNGEH